MSEDKGFLIQLTVYPDCGESSKVIIKSLYETFLQGQPFTQWHVCKDWADFSTRMTMLTRERYKNWQDFNDKLNELADGLKDQIGSSGNAGALTEEEKERLLKDYEEKKDAV